MNLTMQDLVQCFEVAHKMGARFIAVEIEIEGFKEPEIIINRFENILDKLDYYKKAYNDDLTLKSFSGIKIVGFAWSNNIEELEDYL